MSCNLDLSTTAFWSLIDLGNIGGAAKASNSHPTARDAAWAAAPCSRFGTWTRISPARLVLPASVPHVVLLGDGDFDPVMTQCAMYRWQVRFSAPGRTVYVAWAPPGMDSADLVCERDGIQFISLNLQAAQPMAKLEFPVPEASARARPASGARIRQWRCSPGGKKKGGGADAARMCPPGAGGPKGWPGDLDRRRARSPVNEAELVLIGATPSSTCTPANWSGRVVHEAPGADMVPTSVHGLTEKKSLT